MLILGLNLLKDFIKAKTYLSYTLITFCAFLLLIGIFTNTLPLCTMLMLAYAYSSKTLSSNKEYLNNGIFEQWYLYPIGFDLIILCEMVASSIIALVTTMPFVFVNMFIATPCASLISATILATCSMSTANLYYDIATEEKYANMPNQNLMRTLLNATIALIAYKVTDLTLRYRICTLAIELIAILYMYGNAKKKLLTKI